MAAALTAAIAGPAASFEIGVGLGADDLTGGDALAPGGFVELRAAPLLGFGALGLGATAIVEGDVDGDVFGGAGPLVVWTPFEGGLRVEGGVAFGGYRAGDSGNDLGAGYAFRSSIGASYPLDARLRLGAVFAHKSNAGFADDNPGVESLYLTIGYAF
jgi:hypothetical protein